jgi:hypothetical protein
LEKICHSATFSTTNTAKPDAGLNLGRRAGTPPTNRLSYGTAVVQNVLMQVLLMEMNNNISL